MNQNIFQVKVSIYKNGVEKAFMLFNATAADKMRWFTPSRIIDSSWVDLQSTTKQYFAMFQPTQCDTTKRRNNCTIITSNKYVIITMCNLCPKPSVPSVQVTGMISLQCVTYVLTFSTISTSNKYVIITTCILCPKPSVPSGQVPTPSTKGYVLLMKGVTGVGTYPPGVPDLFELRNSTKTINEFQPEALALTPNFPGHYKPILSNNWTGLCLDKRAYKSGACAFLTTIENYKDCRLSNWLNNSLGIIKA
ncbi:unnamed protein product [Mytilus coruscus]|uniref:Uncharacterized protein n=1 Tax=Mytilus coruscus TaxID=42192 RepID=A0A6J8BGP3_MYTCO|nr:unnamed protein product [Mytilus coruscus]